MNRTPILFLNVLIIATCGLVYELLAGTLASYVLGDSVTQFSLIIGIYLFALGAGAWLSRFIERELARRFVDVELGVAILGGLSAPLLFLTFAHLSYFQVVLYTVVFLIGTLVGLEIPLLMRILKDNLDFKELVARVLAFDYVGALAASLLFPLFLVPRLGLVRTSLLFGILNAAVGLWGTWLMRPLISGSVAGLRWRACFVLVLLAFGVYKADALTSLAEDAMFADDIVYARTTHYQRIVVTRGRAGFQLFLNGNLQFSSTDEYRYHEALVHPAMMLLEDGAAAAEDAAGGGQRATDGGAAAEDGGGAASAAGGGRAADVGGVVEATGGGRAARRVLVLGGGDGLAVREVLRYPSVESVTLVDLDEGMTDLSRRFPSLAELNRHALADPRVRVVNMDAMIWLEEDTTAPPFDVCIVDFPDPNSFALGKLYTTRFYRLLRSRLAPDGAVAVQCTSPLFARSSYWCIIRTMEAAGFSVKPYHVPVPSFGVWGFALARRAPFDPPSRAPDGLRFLDDRALAAMFVLPVDLSPVPVEINRLDNQTLVRYYEAEWRRYE